MIRMFRRFAKSKSGAASIEGAFIFPLLVFCIMTIFMIGNFLINLNMAQRSVEKSARIARMMDEPTKTEIEAVLAENLESPMFGQFIQNVEVYTDENGWNYANLNVSYGYILDVPFGKPVRLLRKSSTRIPIRNMPG